MSPGQGSNTRGAPGKGVLSLHSETPRCICTHVPCRRGEPGYVKRPENAFILYRNSRIDKDRGGRKLRQAEISKAISREWKSLTLVEKQSWFDRAREVAEEHRERHPDYKYRPQYRNEQGTKEKRRSVQLHPYESIVALPCPVHPSAAPASPIRSAPGLLNAAFKQDTHSRTLSIEPEATPAVDMLAAVPETARAATTMTMAPTEETKPTIPAPDFVRRGVGTVPAIRSPSPCPPRITRPRNPRPHADCSPSATTASHPIQASTMLATENATDSGSFEALDPTTYHDPLELLFPLPASATAQDFYGILFPAPNEGSDQVAGGDHIPLPVLDRLSECVRPSPAQGFYDILFPGPNEGSDQVAGGDIPLPVLDCSSEWVRPSQLHSLRRVLQSFRTDTNLTALHRPARAFSFKDSSPAQLRATSASTVARAWHRFKTLYTDPRLSCCAHMSVLHRPSPDVSWCLNEMTITDASSAIVGFSDGAHESSTDRKSRTRMISVSILTGLEMTAGLAFVASPCRSHDQGLSATLAYLLFHSGRSLPPRARPSSACDNRRQLPPRADSRSGSLGKLILHMTAFVTDGD